MLRYRHLNASTAVFAILLTVELAGVYWWALDHGRDVEICTNVRLLPYNTADNFGRCLRNSLPNS